MIKEIEIENVLQDSGNHVIVETATAPGLIRITVKDYEVGLTVEIDPHDILRAYNALKGDTDG